MITVRNGFRDGGVPGAGETAEHLRVAQTEVLKAARSALDAIVAMLDATARESGGRTRRRVKVE